jgi:hypothetical protein
VKPLAATIAVVYFAAVGVFADSNIFVDSQSSGAMSALLQKTSDKVGQVNKPIQCETPARVPSLTDVEYETCTRENDYFEKMLPKNVNLAFSDHANAIHPKCIFEAQKRFPDPGFAGSCKNSQAFPKGNISRPCLTEKYLSLVYNSFTQVAKCFKVPENQLFPSVALESGFQVNALGRNMDAGISQLTGSLIQAINERYFDEFLEKAKTSQACSAVLPAFRKLPDEPNHRCAAMTPPDNPTQSLIYAAILYQTNEQVIAAGVNSVKSRLPKDLDIESLRQALTVLSFNAAPGSINLALRQFVASRGATLTADDFKMTRDIPTTFASYMQQHFPVDGENQAARRNTISFYLPAALNLNRKIEEQMQGGEKCMSPALKKLF